MTESNFLFQQVRCLVLQISLQILELVFLVDSKTIFQIPGHKRPVDVSG